LKDKAHVAGRWLLAERTVSDDATLVCRREQVTDAFLKLRMPIYRYLITLCDSPAEAEELTQEAFLHLYDDLLKGRQIESVPAWVFRVAHNLAMDRQRRRQLEGTIAGPENLVGRESTGWGSHIEENLLQKERHGILRSRMAKLTPQERQCLELRAEGLRYREIAEILGIGIPTVQTFLSRAVRKMSVKAHD
jgi:RNA polymerase sigma-70 factor (ECF subfamily)